MNELFSRVRFRAINKHLIESLICPSLFFAKPSMLNDPFDCQLDIHGSLTRSVLSATSNRQKIISEFLNVPHFLENWKCLLDNLGVCSFSSAINDTILWSYYADGHRGVCVLYEFPESFILDKSSKFMAGGNVSYTPEPLSKFLDNFTPTTMEQFIKDLLLIYLKTKSPLWKHENEARLIRREHGVFNISGESIKEIRFGLRTQKSDIDLITKLAGDYCGCTRFSHMYRDESDYGIKIKAL